MLSKTFLHLINVSIMASWLVLAIVIFRLLFKKAPKYITCALWALVAIRLIFPISIESPVSLIPSKETIPLEIEYSQAPAIDTGIDSLNTAFNPVIQQNFTPTGELTSINPIQLPIHIGAYLWQMGIIAMVLYALISYIRIRFKVRERVKQGKIIYICDRIPSPFILGIICPKIYLPSHLGEEDAAFVIAHEKAHIKRLDYIWKPLGYILLTIYWFNPLLWLGYILLCRDIEYACDEKVVREMNGEEKKSYSETLLNLSIHRPYVTACPLAFGESGVKGRIISVLNYKKPAFWVIAVAVILCVVMAVCFLTNPPADKSENVIGTYTYMQTPDSISFLPYLELYENNKFHFAYDELMNFIISGEYELTDNELILHSNRGVYTFTVDDNSFIFNAEKSDEKPSSVPDGSAFVKTQQIDESNEFPTLSAFSETPDTTLKDGLQDDGFNKSTNDYIGKYTFREIWSNITNEIRPSRIYDLTIYEDNGLKAQLEIYGYPESKKYLCDVKITDKGATLYLNKYLDSPFTNEANNDPIGAELLSIKISNDDEIITTWGVIQPQLPENIENLHCFERSLEDQLFYLVTESEYIMENYINNFDSSIGWYVDKVNNIIVPPANSGYSFDKVCDIMKDYCNEAVSEILVHKNGCVINPDNMICWILADGEATFNDYVRSDFNLITGDPSSQNDIATAIFLRRCDNDFSLFREYLYTFEKQANGKFIITNIEKWNDRVVTPVDGVW